LSSGNWFRNFSYISSALPWGRWEKGEGRREKGEGRREKGEGRREKGEGRREKGEGRREKGEGTREKGKINLPCNEQLLFPGAPKKNPFG
jgi:hypothetical protein